ncbi:MAG: DUF3078 domain-containing protein [Salinivirgaceae bacterium]|nr:DUF3078 domain-containing protein [Salinivirgaceae bacterium]
MNSKFLIFVLFILTGNLSFSQIVNIDSVPKIDYFNYIETYFEKFPPKNSIDSQFYQSYNYLLPFEQNDSLKLTLYEIDNLIKNNSLLNQTKKLIPFRDTVEKLNQLRQEFLADYWQRKRLEQIADTSSISSSDSIFLEVLETVAYMDTINFDSILHSYEPYNDTILKSLNFVIDKFQNSRYISWVKQIRRDTSNFYIVDLEGDSLLLKLYNNSPEMVPINLTDYWGNNVQAVVRDINSNSFRVLVDYTPEITNNADEKAKQAISGLNKRNKIKREFTLKRRPYNPPKQRWILGGNSNVDMSQIALHQWAKGGESSISLLSGLELYAKYKGDKYFWDNIASFSYGFIRQGEYKDTSIQLRTNEDKINLNSKYGRKVFGNYSVTIMGDFKSQFSKAYEWEGNIKLDKQISEFMSPGYLTFAFGLDYKPNKNTTLFLSPLTSKSTYVLIDSLSIKEKFGVDIDKKVRHEMGAIFKASYKMKIWDEIIMQNKLELFSSYLENPENVDLDWEFKLILPVNDFIRASISTNILYDDNIFVTKERKSIDEEGNTVFDEQGNVLMENYNSKGMQVREMITVGFSILF